MTGTRENRAQQVKRLKMDREKRADEMKHQEKSLFQINVHVISYNKNGMMLRKATQRRAYR
jgi:hypothetical protein